MFILTCKMIILTRRSCCLKSDYYMLEGPAIQSATLWFLLWTDRSESKTSVKGQVTSLALEQVSEPNCFLFNNILIYGYYTSYVLICFFGCSVFTSDVGKSESDTFRKLWAESDLCLLFPAGREQLGPEHCRSVLHNSQYESSEWNKLWHHLYLPARKHYEWQLLSGTQWLRVDNDHVIESHYCQPGAKGITINTSQGSGRPFIFSMARIRTEVHQVMSCVCLQAGVYRLW